MNAKKTDKSHYKPHHSPQLEANEAKTEGDTKVKGPLPPVNTKKGKQIDVSDFFVNSQEPKVSSFNSRSLTRSAFKDGRRSISELVKDAKEIKPLGSISKPKNPSRKNNRTSSPPYGGDSLDYTPGSPHNIQRSKGGSKEHRTSSPHYRDNLEYMSGSSSLRRSRIPEEYLQGSYHGDIASGSAGITRLKEAESPEKFYHNIRVS